MITHPLIDTFIMSAKIMILSYIDILLAIFWFSVSPSGVI